MPQAEACGSVDDGGFVGIAGCTLALPGKNFRSAGKMIPGHAAIGRGGARGNWNYVKRFMLQVPSFRGCFTTT